MNQTLTEYSHPTPRLSKDPEQQEPYWHAIRKKIIDAADLIHLEQLGAFHEVRPIYWKQLYAKTTSLIARLEELGLWDYPHPDIECIRRRIPECADNRIDWSAYGCTPLTCIKAGWYLANPVSSRCSWQVREKLESLEPKGLNVD